MTAMQVFERCKDVESDKQALRERITRYHESAARMSATLDGIGARSTAESDKLSAIMAEIDLLERSIGQRDKEYAAELAAACKLLDMLPRIECKIIDSFYIKGKSLANIARELSYSYGYVRTTKSQACAHLGDIPEDMVAQLLPDWYLDTYGK
ncbi:MAG: hypothetical protein IKK75_13910 [Clostridia bacterium]|nr:hypothetical protein [Clostridia bacterium]